ncbi:ABC transporter ATP-binding protein [Catellatospora sichuanensis]|uniref:ABC transporter ATP-binding protein n=1 Tax=Catellatospora sichuanensis TaxID=1969805 RepID=UPI00118265BE|nr:ABC transporter ATP-binding protein [Catellatospora sichuanensis]
MTAAIEVRQAARTYRVGQTEVAALRGVSLTVRRGDHIAVVGPSGSGKSTLLQLLGGLDRPTAGSVVIDGHDTTTVGEAELARIRNRVVGFVFQGFHLQPRTSALDNVALPLVYRGVRRAERRRRAAELLDRVGLGARARHLPGQLSGGEQQRVAIARALVTEPAVLLADEPTGNLDSASGGHLLDLLEQLNAEHGVALAVVTHDHDVAARARRRIVMRDGRIITDTEHDITAAPTGPARA